MLRVLTAEHPENPEYSLALEEALYISVSKLGSFPILRIWRHRDTIVLGYFQIAEEEVHVDRALNEGVRIVRRLTGGGAVYHDFGCLLWSIIARGPPEGGIDYVYGNLLRGFVEFLKDYADAKVENINDIVIGGKKVSGTAATYDRKGTYLLHGTLLMDTDLNKLSYLLKVPKRKLEDKGISDVKYRVGNLFEIIGRELETWELVEKLINSYSKLLNLKPIIDVPTSIEYKIADRLYKEKYSKREWNLERKRIDVDLSDLLGYY